MEKTMENFRKQFEHEIKNLEISEDEVITLKLVSHRFKKKALKVHSDKTGKEDDEEFKKLLNDFNNVKKALEEITDDASDVECEKSDLLNFFEKHNFAKEFSQSWTIFVEKVKVNDWKKALEARYPNSKELQGNGVQYRTELDDKSVSITFYDVALPKMNIQGNHSCIRKFVLTTLPDIYRTIQESVKALESENLEKVPEAEAKNKLPKESKYKCDKCNKSYVKENGLEKHIQAKHSPIIVQQDDNEPNETDEHERSKENCPTCELPKGRAKAFPCHRCKNFIHVDCVSADPQRLEAYKTGFVPYECESCYWELSKDMTEASEKVNKGTFSPVTIEIEDDDHEYQCIQCSFVSTDEKSMENHAENNHTIRCGICEDLFDTLVGLNEHENMKHTSPGQESPTLEETPEISESNVEKHLREKCEFLEIEIGKEKIINMENKKELENQSKRIAALQKEIKVANERTKSENQS
jgi:hypothetical protein